MNSQQQTPPSPEVETQGTWSRVNLWVEHHQHFARTVCLLTGLVVFILNLPAYLRIAFWNDLRAHFFLESMLLVFILVSLSLVWSTGQKIDTGAFLFFNVWRPRPVWLDRFMLSFTQLGSIFATLAIALFLILLNDRLLAYELILGTLTLWPVVELVKYIIHRSRPFIRVTQARIVGYQARGRSFPSGHTSQSFFIATLMVQHFHATLWLSIMLYSIALLVGFTRMYVGAHYPRDVLAGAILGSAWGLLGVIIDTYIL